MRMIPRSTKMVTCWRVGTRLKLRKSCLTRSYLLLLQFESAFNKTEASRNSLSP